MGSLWAPHEAQARLTDGAGLLIVLLIITKHGTTPYIQIYTYMHIMYMYACCIACIYIYRFIHLYKYIYIYKWRVCLGSYILDQEGSSDIRGKQGGGQGEGHGIR